MNPSPQRVAQMHLEAIAKTPSWWKALVSRQKGIFYRGVPSSGRGSGLGALGEGVYLTWDKGIAGFYANNQGNPRGKKGFMYLYKVPSNLKMIDEESREYAELKKEMGMGPKDYSDNPLFARILTLKVKERGYDGVVSSDLATGFVVYDAPKLKLVSKIPMADVVWE